MDLTERDDALYAAFKAKDTRFDGRFFVGISSTGVYCRPVCRARQTKRSSCTFFSSAAEAEQAGYRPCLLCRPELAPGNSLVDATSVLARKAARLLEENCGSGQSLEQLAAGVSERVPCHAGAVFTDLPPAAGEEPADRHRSVCAGGGDGGGVRESAPDERLVPETV